MDTGAEVRVLGKEVYNRFQEKHPVRRPVTMMQAGDGARLKGFIACQFDVKAGQSTHQVNLYVSPLKDSLLLGIDFLRDHRAKLDLDAGNLCLGSETICMTWCRSPVPWEAQVTLIKKIKVPAGSAVLCPVRLDVGLGDFLVVPGVHLLSDTLLMPHTYHASGDSTAVLSTPLTRMWCWRLRAKWSVRWKLTCMCRFCPGPCVPWLRWLHPRMCPYISKSC